MTKGTNVNIRELISKSMRVDTRTSATDLAVLEPVLYAMRAGLRGERMPDIGTKQPRGLVLLANTVYEEARNWNAGVRARAR